MPTANGNITVVRQKHKSCVIDVDNLFDAPLNSFGTDPTHSKLKYVMLAYGRIAAEVDPYRTSLCTKSVLPMASPYSLRVKIDGEAVRVLPEIHHCEEDPWSDGALAWALFDALAVLYAIQLGGFCHA